MNDNLNREPQRARDAIQALIISFKATSSYEKRGMPEDFLSPAIKPGSIEHILFITLTVSIDYQRDADSLWHSARRTYEDPETAYLFYHEKVFSRSILAIAKDMQKHKLSKKPRRDAFIWQTVALSFLKKWHGDPREFLRDCSWDALEILSRLKNDTHIKKGRLSHDYPYLRGNKIGPLWLRMLRDNIGILDLKSLNRVPIPVDIHVARASLAMGVVRGKYQGAFEPVFENIRDVWFEGVHGLNFGLREMIALDMDKPLWNLSKYGCASRSIDSNECPNKNECLVHDLCVSGKISLTNMRVELDT